MSKILVSGGLVPTTKDTLLDARTRVATFADIANIENPARFMVITVEDTGKKYEVRKLASKIIGGIVVENSTININDPEALVDLGLAEELRSEDEKVRQSNESKRIESENLRKSAEDSRKVNETNRVSAEGVREASERTRVSSEETRNANEQIRNSNETKRQSQESTRQSQESARQTNESTRNANESARKEAESERKTEETSRRTAELSRSSAENTRVKNEQNRTTAENTRSSAEDRRVSNETQRTANETARNNAELSREQAEGNRASTFNTLKGQMQTTIQEGQTAVAATEKATSDAQKVVDEYDTKVAEQDSKLTELGSEVNSINLIFDKGEYSYGYITTGDVGASVSSLVSNGSTYWKSIIASANAGERFYIKGKGGGNARLWAFLDSNNVVLSSSTATYTSVGEEIVAPTNSALLVANFANPETDTYAPTFSLYKRSIYGDKIELLKTEHQENVNNINQLSKIVKNNSYILKVVPNVPIDPTGTGFVNTYAELGTIIDLDIDSSTDNDWIHYIIPIWSLYSIKVTGKGGSNARLWAFLDDENRLLSISASSVRENNLILAVPKGATKLVVNTDLNNNEVSEVTYVKDYREVDEKLENINRDINDINLTFDKGEYSDGYITTGEVGVTVSSLVSNGSTYWKSIVVNVKANNKFYIKGKGGSGSRLWAFLDANNVVLSCSSASYTSIGEEIVAPNESALLVCNFANPENDAKAPTFYIYTTSRYDDEIKSLSERINNIEENKEVNVLIFGNSYSYRCCAQGDGNILSLCKSLGVNLFVQVIGNGGGSFESNYTKYLNGGTNDYRWEGDSNTGIQDKASSPLTLKEALEYREWDYIIFHQSSRYSGNIDSFSPYLDRLIDTAKTYCKNENVKIGLMQTWAYADIVLQDSGTPIYPTTSTTTPAFSSQEEMYGAICDTYKQALSNFEDVSFVIPCGTALQNARTTELGANYNDFGAGPNDGSHTNSVGTLITTLAIFNKVYGEKNNVKLSEVQNNYSTLLNDDEFDLAVESVRMAIKFPFKVTQTI